MPWLAQAVLMAAVGASSPPEGLVLNWDAPEECPDEAAVRAAFERHAKADYAGVEARGVVTRDASGYVLELELRGAGGEEARRIEAETCDALADTAGLLIAVASEPGADAPLVPEPEEPEPEEPEELEPEPAPAVEPEPQPAPEPTSSAPGPEPETPSPTLPVQLIVRADGVVQALRLLPQIVGGGVAGAVGVSGANWRAELRGLYIAPQPRDYEDLAVGGVFDLWTLGAAGCWAPARSRLTFPVCAGVDAGSLRGRARDVDEPGSGGSFYASAIGDATLVFAPIPRVGLRAGVGGAVSLRRPRFHVRGRDTLFRAGPGALRGFLGVEVRFL